MLKPPPLPVLLLLHHLLLLLQLLLFLQAQSNRADPSLTPHRMVKCRLRWHGRARACRARPRTSSGHAACPWRSGTAFSCRSRECHSWVYRCHGRTGWSSAPDPSGHYWAACGRVLCQCHHCVRDGDLWGGASQWDLSCCAWRKCPFPATEPEGGCAPVVGEHSGAPWHSSGCTHHRALPGPTLTCCRQRYGPWGADLPPVDPCRRDRPWRGPSGLPRSMIRSEQSATKQRLLS